MSPAKTLGLNPYEFVSLLPDVAAEIIEQKETMESNSKSNDCSSSQRLTAQLTQHSAADMSESHQIGGGQSGWSTCGLSFDASLNELLSPLIDVNSHTTPPSTPLTHQREARANSTHGLAETANSPTSHIDNEQSWLSVSGLSFDVTLQKLLTPLIDDDSPTHTLSTPPVTPSDTPSPTQPRTSPTKQADGQSEVESLLCALIGSSSLHDLDLHPQTSSRTPRRRHESETNHLADDSTLHASADCRPNLSTSMETSPSQMEAELNIGDRDDERDSSYRPEQSPAPPQNRFSSPINDNRDVNPSTPQAKFGKSALIFTSIYKVLTF